MAGIAGANELNNRKRFRGFYRTDASSEFVGPALAGLARQFNWTQMAVISRDESLFLMVCYHHFLWPWALFIIQIVESLESIFEVEQRVLEASIILKRNTDTIPYDRIHTLVRTEQITVQFLVVYVMLFRPPRIIA